MIKIYVKTNYRAALFLLGKLLKETPSREAQMEFFRINDVEFDVHIGFSDIGDEVFPTSKHPEWWYLGGAFVIEDLIELRNRDVIWKAESYDRTK